MYTHSFTLLSLLIAWKKFLRAKSLFKSRIIRMTIRESSLKRDKNYASVSVHCNLKVELSMISTFNLDVYYKQILEILRSPNFADQNFSTKGREVR